MDISRLNQGEKIAGASAIALFIFMFFTWYGFDISTPIGSFSVNANINAWDAFSFIDLFLLLTVVVALVAVGMRASSNDAGFPMSTAVTVLGGVSALLILFRIIDPPGDGLSLKLGIFLGLIAAAGIGIGGYLGMQEEGTSFSDAADHVSGGGGASEPPAPTPTPPPPPPAAGPDEPPLPPPAGEPPAPPPPPPPPPPVQGA